MAKYGKKLTSDICKLVKADSYTIAEICRVSDISESTFHEWKSKKTEFSESIKKAQNERNQMFAIEAKKSLLKKIQGYTLQEKRTVSVDSGVKDESGESIPKIKEQTITEKYFPPDTTAIIFTLCNTDPENWKNRVDPKSWANSGDNPNETKAVLKLPNGEEIEV